MASKQDSQEVVKTKARLAACEDALPDRTSLKWEYRFTPSLELGKLSGVGKKT